MDAFAGWDHSLALRIDGSIAAWGNNNYGQCDVPAPNEGFTAVYTGSCHSFGLRPVETSVEPPSPDPGGCGLAIVSLYPNPTASTSEITFVAPSSGDLLLEVFDTSGRLAHTEQIGVPEPGLHAELLACSHGMPPGVYLVRVTMGGMQSAAARLVLVR